MRTPSASARNVTATLQHMVEVSPGRFDADAVADVIDAVIRNATRDRDTKRVIS